MSTTVLGYKGHKFDIFSWLKITLRITGILCYNALIILIFYNLDPFCYSWTKD